MEVGHLPPPVAHTELGGGAALRLRWFQQVMLWFHTKNLNMCIFKRYVCVCEGWHRCTMPLWVVTRSSSLCCWRPRQQWILKTIKVKTHRSSQNVLTFDHETIIKKQENKHMSSGSDYVAGNNTLLCDKRWACLKCNKNAVCVGCGIYERWQICVQSKQ